MLAEEFDVLLSHIAGLVNCFAALPSSFDKLFGLVLDLGMESVEDREDNALELFRSIKVSI